MRDQGTFELKGVYHTLYNAITRPDFKFSVTRYFIDEWLPVLGVSSAWLIVGLRQHCYWNRRQSWCIVDKATLAKDTSLDERTIERSLNKGFAPWFVTVAHRYRYRTDLGKRVRDKNRYELLLDDPLSPRHQLGLEGQLRGLIGSEADTLDDALAAVRKLLNTPHLTDKISYTNPVPKNLPHRTLLQLVEDIWHLNLAAYENERTVQLNQACDQLYNRIVQPNKIYVGWQYFRQKWVPHLGHTLAWIIVYLRTRCYWDEKTGELRDETILFKKDVAAAIGQTPRNMGNVLNSQYADLFFTMDEGARNQPTHYQVRMVDEPLTPEDRVHLAQKLKNQLQGTYYDIDPENGQLNFLPQLSNRQNFAYGQVSEILSARNEKKSRLDANQPEKMPQHGTGKNAVTEEDSILCKDNIIQKQQKHHAVAATPNGIGTLLNDLEIHEPTRSRLLANPNLTIATIGAWFLYAETQSNLKDVRAFVIKRLLENDPPPPNFLAFSQLDDATWNLFDKTAHRMRIGKPVAVEIEPDLQNVFLQWVEVYGGLDASEAHLLLNHPPRSFDDTSGEHEVVSDHNNIDQSLWQNILGQLRPQMTQATFDTWVKGTWIVSQDDGQMVVGTKNPFAKDWLENRLYATIHRTASAIIGQPVEIKFVLSNEAISGI